MRDRIDPLIAERAPWLFSDTPGVGVARQLLEHMLCYRRSIELAKEVAPLSSHGIMSRVSDMIANQLSVIGLENLPRSGPAMVVANHPTGIADGIMLYSALASRRPDLYFYANSDILRILPQMRDMIAPVEWRTEKRSVSKTRETMAYTKMAMEQGRLGVIFPSGRLAKRHGLRLHERPWMASAAMIARKFDVPVVPINIRARNSVLFYLFDKIHPTLRDITLFYETLNKARQPYRVKIGRPIAASDIPSSSTEGIEVLSKATLALGGKHSPNVSLVQATRMPMWLRKRGVTSWS